MFYFVKQQYEPYCTMNDPCTAHNMYWKISKNFADGVSYHIKDSLFLNSPTDGHVV